MAWGNFVKIAVILPDSGGCYAEVRHQFNSVEAPLGRHGQSARSNGRRGQVNYKSCRPLGVPKLTVSVWRASSRFQLILNTSPLPQARIAPALPARGAEDPRAGVSGPGAARGAGVGQLPRRDAAPLQQLRGPLPRRRGAAGPRRGEGG